MADETLLTVLVIQHQANVSLEGAIYQRNAADNALVDLGLTVVAATTGLGDAMTEGMRIMKLTWGVEDA